MGVLAPQVIQKEKIPTLHFDYADVLSTEFEKNIRRQGLYKAMILGNTYKKKVGITFETKEGTRYVETTVWAATENNILLKGGIFIPICCIKDVAFLA